MAAEPAKPLRADARRNRERVLEAARSVFAAKGATASTEEIAREAEVGIGTVFRHFPTKDALLQAIIQDSLDHLFDEAEALVSGGAPDTALFTFFTRMVDMAAANRAVVEILAGAGADLPVAKVVERLRETVTTLLARAQQVGGVRADARPPEVLALLTGTCQAALATEWDGDVRERALTIVFDGLRPVRTIT
ncbi:AcrR family transcriptional regulator [Lipingzhangella halophila]|uniref:AcrR family transcriptional regulator n=1 Tax=Lipingzhangella halophila TaxID=1783352 RepID=A0A7W7RJD3_9ACTN|nr:TetR/AcrR family transcriptional regulator [Lipingzhangella halophila]MBB4933040.1 AcrR family transcriptional regulator [Lipingzhangella halophila]